ncbi:MAG: CGNR zinc finger domain-containing protein [Chloroflexi bacterium]|nr:CGNR zinc finger domain-containing protein [Chloroflexota bacterium]
MQPGGRPAAPGDLALVQEFINTHYDVAGGTGGELLKTAELLSLWLSDHGLIDPGTVLSASQLARALAIREGLRSLAFSNTGEPAEGHAVAALGREGPSAVVEITLGGDGPSHRPMGHDAFERAIAVLVAIVARAMLVGSWARMKACPGEHCGWAFYDRSRNRTGRWCSMSICGGRAKARAHYERGRHR